MKVARSAITSIRGPPHLQLFSQAYGTSPMDVARLIILVLCSLLGVAVSLLLIALLLRQKKADAGTRIGIMLGFAVFAMYSSVCGNAIVRYYAISRLSWASHHGTPMLTGILSFLPALILWSWRKSPVLQWRSKVSIWLFAFACANGCLVVVTALSFGPEPLLNTTFDRVLGLNGVLCLTPAVVSILRLPLDARLKTFMKATSSIYVLASLIGVVSTPGVDDKSLHALILFLLVQACILIGLLGSFIVAARFRFADVFVRWSTRITILGVLSLVGSLSFVLVGVGATASHRSAGILACSVELVVLLLLGMVLTERCGRWVESHVLQRLDLKAEAVRLQNQLFTIENREDLFGFIETELTRRLEVRDVRIVPRTSVSREILSMQSSANAPLEINSYSMPLQIDTLQDVDLLIPIPSNGKTEEMLGVSTGSGRQSLNSGEIGFLKDLGRDVGVRLHHLEVEAFHRRQALRETLLRQQLTEAELRALRAQVNPHFLFNSLNTIADLIIRDPANAERMTLRLSSVFRHVLAQADRQFVTLGEEFEFLRNYLDIEQARFGENLQVCLAANPQLAPVPIPTLLLQPLVENALKHGLAPKGGRRSLEVTATIAAETILLEVVDDGVGFSTETPFAGIGRSKSGVGLANTRARLLAAYGEDGCLQIESVPMEGCRVSVSIPYTKVQS